MENNPSYDSKTLDDYLEYAINLATARHFSQRDKAGEPYILHVLRVMHNVKSKPEKIVAVLHDILEDTETTIEELERNLPEVLVTAICCLTHDNQTSYKTYIGCIKFNPIATNVKIADLRDNLDITRLPEITDRDVKRVNKYWKSLRELESVKSSQQPILVYIDNYYPEYAKSFWE